ncbi:MAG: hypothetical protein KAS32_19415 [Candidatus Peribacteraceae bacterium]|nr:hypothetical protein [Candidatus Peribacteraceae bacterium]
MNEILTPVGKPKPKVQLAGLDGNAYSIMGRVVKALRRNGHTKEEISQYKEESMNGDYDHLLRVALKWTEEPDEEEEWDLED